MGAPLKIALFHPALAHGGIQRVFVNLARGFVERGHAVDLVQATDASDDFRVTVPQNIRLVDLHASRAATSVPALVRYLRRERPSAVIAGAMQTNVMAVIARELAGVPLRLVLTEHNFVRTTAEHAPTVRGRLAPQFLKVFYPAADEIVCVSAAIADELAASAGIARDRLHVIYNPVLTPELEQLSRQPLNHPWFRAGEPPVILAAGRLTRAKDYPTLLRAFAILRQQRRVRLMILGEGEERAALEALVTALRIQEDVALPGSAQNPYPYMRDAALFVLSSRFEGLPTAMIEALALGAKVVASDCASGPAEILGTREGLVPIGDATALAARMQAVLELPLQPAPDLGRFRMDHAVDAYLRLIATGQRAETAAEAR